MKTKSIGFIGGGRITKIFLQALNNKKAEFQSIVVFDTNAYVINDLQAQFPFITIGDLQKTAGQSTVFIALHPPMIMETLDKTTFEVAEPKLEAYALLSAMLPTYFWFQWNELVKLGIQMGLNEEESNISVQQTLIAAINLMFNSDLSPEKVMDLIPVKPIGEHQAHIVEIYQTKLLGLFEKIKP